VAQEGVLLVEAVPVDEDPDEVRVDEEGDEAIHPQQVQEADMSCGDSVLVGR